MEYFIYFLTIALALFIFALPMILINRSCEYQDRSRVARWFWYWSSKKDWEFLEEFNDFPGRKALGPIWFIAWLIIPVGLLRTLPF